MLTACQVGNKIDHSAKISDCQMPVDSMPDYKDIYNEVKRCRWLSAQRAGSGISQKAMLQSGIATVNQQSNYIHDYLGTKQR